MTTTSVAPSIARAQDAYNSLHNKVYKPTIEKNEGAVRNLETAARDNAGIREMARINLKTLESCYRAGVIISDARQEVYVDKFNADIDRLKRVKDVTAEGQKVLKSFSEAQLCFEKDLASNRDVEGLAKERANAEEYLAELKLAQIDINERVTWLKWRVVETEKSMEAYRAAIRRDFSPEWTVTKALRVVTGRQEPTKIPLKDEVKKPAVLAKASR
jgi:hypothetical protein